VGYVAGFIFSLPLHPCGRQKWFEEVSVLQRQAHLPVRTIPRLTLVLALSAMALANTACDYFYNVSIENATDQEVVVKVLWVDRNLRPCSVQGSIAWHGPPSGESIEAEAHAVGGEEIPAEVRVVPPNDRSVWPGVYVRILPQQTLSCPDPILHMYLLTVKNLALNSIDMWMDGVHLGKGGGRSDATFGPLLGDWEGGGTLEVRSHTKNLLGEDYGYWGSWDYDLGQVPLVKVVISR